MVKHHLKTLVLATCSAIILLVFVKYTILSLHDTGVTWDVFMEQFGILYVMNIVSEFFIIVGAVVLGTLFAEYIRKKNNTEYSQKAIKK